MRATIAIEVVRGSNGFADACRLAASSLALVACANAAANVPPQALERASPVETAAVNKLNAALSDQRTPAFDTSVEQDQTLKYGIYPPVKTTIKIAGKTETHWTLHPFDLVRLSREASAEAARIEGIRVSPEKIGALMIAESSMVSRVGWSANGKTPSFGLAQLELNTAKSLGISDPNDPRQAALAVARLLAQGQRFARMHNRVDEQIAVSLAYNTSTSLRNSLVNQYGGGLTVDKLPPATQNHIKNMAYGGRIMALFSRLNDQHDKTVLAQRTRQIAQASIPSPTLVPVSFIPKESAMNTSNTPTPSTRNLVNSLSTDSANRKRLEDNQIQLERSGHLQPLPMTSQGLAQMRSAITAHVDQTTSAMKVSGTQSTSTIGSIQLLSKVGAEVASIALALQSQVRATLAVLREKLTVIPAVASPTQSSTVAAIQNAKQTGAQFMAMSQQTMRDIGEQRLLREQAAQQQRPV